MRVDSFWENGAPLPFTPARYSGLSVGVPARSPAGPTRFTATARSRSRRRSRPRSGSPARGSSSTRPSSRRPRGTWTSSTTSRRRPRSSSTPTGRRRTSAPSSATPISHARTSGLLTSARRASTASDRGRDRRDGAAAAGLTDGDQRLATRADDERDLRTYEAPERAPTRVSYRASTSTGWDRPRAAARPWARRSTSSRATRSQARRASASCTCSSKRRATRSPTGRVPGRRGLRRRPAAWAPLGRVRGDATGADQGDRRAGRRPARRPVAVRRCPQPCSRARPPTTRALDDAPERLRPLGERRLLHVHDRVDRRFRARRPRLGLPAQQRADRLRLRAPAPSEQRRGRKRPRSSMAPTLVTHGGRPLLTVGSPGGSMIITVLQLLLDRLDGGMTLPQAIADPRASQRNGATTAAEPAFRACRSPPRSRHAAIASSRRPRSAPRPGSSSSRPAGW